MRGCKCSSTRLSAVSLGVASGVVTGLCMMLLALASLHWGYGIAFVTQLSDLYHGYGPTFEGSLYGLGFGFLKGFILGLVFGWIYNLCRCCCRGCSRCVCEDSAQHYTPVVRNEIHDVRDVRDVRKDI